MKVLLTGASSFSGMWFARELARAGHEVTATFTRKRDQYSDARAERVAIVLQNCKGVFGCAFGDDEFLRLAGSESWDALCHHGADVTNYRSPDFDVLAAVRGNTRNAAKVFRALGDASGGRARVVATGSVFEHDEGAGSEDLPAFSPYGISKGFTYQVLRHEAARAGLTLGKFVIANPFGPYEEPRFTAYLVKTWFAGETAAVKTPEYVRDNIHVSLLARLYARFAEGVGTSLTPLRFGPMGYVESQGAFATRFAAEMRPRLGLPCKLTLERQTEFSEPRVRVNTSRVGAGGLGWNESVAWDEIAGYYKSRFAKVRP